MSKFDKQISRQLWMQYILVLLAWAFGGLLTCAFLWYLCSTAGWEGREFVYFLMSWFHKNAVFVYLMVTGVGWLVISYQFLSRPMQYLSALLDAAEALAHPGEEPITLPKPLEQVETQLNLIRERAIRNALVAREAEQRKNDLVVYLAHDLKTPLTSIIGYLILLRDEPDLSPEFRARYTNIALDKAERLEDLINEFFDITRFNLSHLELEKQPVDIARMLQQVASEFTPLLDEQGLTCTLDLPETLVCPCDPDKLARVFDNLLRNACHYSRPGTAVELAATIEKTSVVLTFTNQGITIPPEKLERIFDQFFRLDSSRTTRTGGVGLGLAIAKEIVEFHGGAISARSVEGVTTFTVSLPKS